MKKFKGLMTSLTPHWSTPKWLYDELNKEFNFDFDPCPLHSDFDGLKIEWGKSNFINPPYNREITKWLNKGFEELKKGKMSVFLLPARTDTKWWHDYVMEALEIRFIKGRLKFGDSKNSAPFPSCIVILKEVNNGKKL